MSKNQHRYPDASCLLCMLVDRTEYSLWDKTYKSRVDIHRPSVHIARNPLLPLLKGFRGPTLYGVIGMPKSNWEGAISAPIDRGWPRRRPVYDQSVIVDGARPKRMEYSIPVAVQHMAINEDETSILRHSVLIKKGKREKRNDATLAFPSHLFPNTRYICLTGNNYVRDAWCVMEYLLRK